MRQGRFLKVTLTAFMGALLVWLTWVVFTGVKQHERASPSERPTSQADMGMDLFSLKQIRNGRLAWDIQARRAELFEGNHKLSLQGMQATLWTEDGLQVSFSGDHGFLNTETRDFEMQKDEGDLAVRMSNGYIIQAPSLTWKDQQREIVSDHPMQITGQGLRIRGGQLIVKLASRQFTVNKDVHVTVEP